MAVLYLLRCLVEASNDVAETILSPKWSCPQSPAHAVPWQGAEPSPPSQKSRLSPGEEGPSRGTGVPLSSNSTCSTSWKNDKINSSVASK